MAQRQQDAQQQSGRGVRGDVACRRQCHPSRQMRSCSVRLSDDQEVLRAMAGSAENLDLIARARMERVIDANQLDSLFAGTM